MKAALILFLGVLTAQAKADAVFVACYGTDSQMGMSFDVASTMFTFEKGHDGGVDDSFESQPATDWQKSDSSITTQVTDQTAYLTAHVVSGDPETPVIEADAEVRLEKDASGSFILVSGSVYHLSQPEDLQEFIGHPCYVQ